MKSISAFVILLLLACSISPAFAKSKSKKLPSWVKEGMALPQPPFRDEEKPEAVVIWDEVKYEVQADGRVKSTTRYALRIVDGGGSYRAQARAYYNSKSTKTPKMKAWTISSNGDVHEYKKKDHLDVSSRGYSLVGESRTLTIDGSSRTRVGDVFAYEYTKTRATIFTQYSWYFQGYIPVASSKIEVSAPEGWIIESKSFDGAPEATKSGNRYRWSMENMISLEWESESPSSSRKRSYLFLQIHPPAGSRARLTNLKFNTWEDMSNFTARIIDPQTHATSELQAKAKELTVASLTVWDKVKAIGEYSQKIPYESISLDIDNGGGYTPRAASETFRVGYGDCKDKSTIMRSLLGVVGIKSYAVIVNATDNDSVVESWPSPRYFNHCITAVEVDDTVEGPAIYEDPELGRLLFVDATSPYTPIGELPFDEQGGLIVLGKKGYDKLLRLPIATPDENKISRNIQAELMPNGSIVGKMDTVLIGDQADEERSKRKWNSEAEYKMGIESDLAAGNHNSLIENLKVEDKGKSDRSFTHSFTFAIQNYSKLMRDTLFIFKPAIVGRETKNPFFEDERTLPVKLRSKKLEESVMIYLPIGFEPDEFKEKVSIENEFGSYHATSRIEGDQLFYDRVFTIEDTVVPVDDYKDLQDFYAAVIEAEQAPIVLARSAK